MSASPVIPLKFIGQIASGGTPKSDAENWNGDVPFITPPDLNGVDGAVIRQWDRSLTSRGAGDSTVVTDAVLLSCRAPIGHVGIVTQNVAFNQGCKAIIPDRPEDLRYLAHALVALRKGLQAAGRGTTFTELSTTELASFSIPWPAPLQRTKIADYLDRETGEIDVMIAKLDGLDETLRLRRSRATQMYLTGFPTVPLGAHCRIVNGSTPLRSQGDFWTSSDGFPWLNSAAVNDAIVLEAPRQVTLRAMTECHLPRVKPGDVLIGITGQGRTRGMAARSGIDCTISQHVAAVQVRDGWDSRFLYYALDAEYQNLRRDSESAGSTKGAITCAMLSQYRVPLPTLEEQTRIADHLDEVTSTIDAMLAKVADLKSLLHEWRAALITDVVTGKKEIA